MMENQTPNESLLEIKRNFLESLQNTAPNKYGRTRSYSPYTIKEYGYDIGVFIRYMGNNLFKSDFNLITLQDVKNFVESLTISKKTINRKLAAIKMFFKYLKTNNIILHNDIRDIESFKIEKTERKALNEEQLEKLLSSFLDATDTYAFRNLTIFYLFNITGIRLGELMNLNCGDIDLKNKTIFIKGIEDLDRVIPFTNSSFIIIRDYLTYLSKFLGRKLEYNDALFWSERKTRISLKMIQHIVKKHIKDAGLSTSEFSTHSLRHTFATMLYDKKVSMLILSKFLGIDVGTLPVYLHSEEDLDSKLNLLQSIDFFENMSTAIKNIS